MKGRIAALVVLAALAAPAGANAHGQQAAIRATALAPTCGLSGADRVITGKFGTDLQGSYVMLPFDVGADPRTTAVRVKYCYDQPETPTSGTPGVSLRHTLDLGLYEPRRRAAATWGIPEFRGWGGSSHPDVTVSAEGFSSKPGTEEPGKTTRAFKPGQIRAGQWAVELGVAAVVPPSQGDPDGVEWRVAIDLQHDAAYADEPYEPAAYDPTPAKRGPGWYAGDFHVHGEHSAYRDAPMDEVFDYAFCPIQKGPVCTRKGTAQAGAGLDFITLSDYVSGSSWGEIGRYQADYPGKLIVRSAEVITYRGHINNHNSAAVVDYREGPIFERQADGSLLLVRGRQPARAIFDQIRAAGGYTQINHPTIFPNEVPGFAFLCRGCPWDYDDRETDYTKVDGIEVATGPAGLKTPFEPGPNPFTVTAIQFWEDALDKGHKIAAVGSSDSHNAGRTPSEGGVGITQAPIGQATTVVYADELSEEGIRRGVEAGHTYVKIRGNDAPDLRLEARRPRSSGRPAIMGDTLRADSASFTARVLGGAPGTGPEPFELVVLKDGLPILVAPVTSGDFRFPFTSQGPGRYRLQLQRSQTVEAVSSPIYLESASAPSPGGGGDGPGGGGTPGGGPPDGGGDGTATIADDAGGGAAVTADTGGSSLPFTGAPLGTVVLAALFLFGLGRLLARR